ncbi:RNA polymerase sigma factor [Roseateles sp. LKC17W]|uniref:RNA polymerase sigma factor n=2 Tax=Pelomonas margarita TaxID=3299031 RepID=A0ABW7FE49_9BURK
MRHYRPLLKAALVKAGVDAREREDLASEIFFKVVTQAHAVRAPEAFHSWLMRIAQHEIAAHWGRQAKERAVFAPPPAPPAHESADDTLAWLAQMPDAQASDPILARCLLGQLARYKQEAPADYACIELLAQGYEDEEIALSMGRQPGGIRQHLSQCCAALMRLLRHCLEGGRTHNWAPKRGQAKPKTGSDA